MTNLNKHEQSFDHVQYKYCNYRRIADPMQQEGIVLLKEKYLSRPINIIVHLQNQWDTKE